MGSGGIEQAAGFQIVIFFYNINSRSAPHYLRKLSYQLNCTSTEVILAHVLRNINATQYAS